MHIACVRYCDLGHGGFGCMARSRHGHKLGHAGVAWYSTAV